MKQYSKYHKFFNTYFNGKVCVITGASSGLGKSLAFMLARFDAKLILIARTESALIDVQTECRALSTHKEIYYVVADVSKAELAKTAIKFSLEQFSHIDILIANAGASMHASLEETSDTIYKLMMDANYYSAVNIILAALPNLKIHKSILVGITSIQSLIGVPYHAAYVASKHAVSGFLESFELEEPQVKVVEFISGWITGTSIREHALDGNGNISVSRKEHKKVHSRSSISVEEAVEAILEGIYKQKRLVFRPKFWKNILFVKYSMRNYLHHLIKTRQSFTSN